MVGICASRREVGRQSSDARLGRWKGRVRVGWDETRWRELGLIESNQ